MFPELQPYLQEAFELAAPGAEQVISRYRKSNANLRTQLLRILRKAGVEPWPRLFQNLRATRETELADAFPLHVVTTWLGNTPKVADKHYLQVTPEHYALAVAQGGANAKAAQIGVQWWRKWGCRRRPHAFADNRTQPREPRDLTPQMAFSPGLRKQVEFPERNPLRNNPLFSEIRKSLTSLRLVSASLFRSHQNRKEPRTKRRRIG